MWSRASADKDGKVRYQRQPQSLGQIVDPRYVAMMNTMMQETLLIGTGRKADLAGRPAAGKTGTSQDFRDGWFVGYTAQLVTARLARQRRFLADQEDDRRRIAVGNLGALHEECASQCAHRQPARRSWRDRAAVPRLGVAALWAGRARIAGSDSRPVPPGSIPGRATTGIRSQ